MSDDTQHPPKQPIIANFEPASTVEVPVDVNVQAKAASVYAVAKAKKSAMLADASEYLKMGAKIVKVKANLAAMLGKHASKLGIKDIGHGRLLVAGDNADAAVEELDALIQEQITSKGINHSFVTALFQLKRDFNKQIIETGEAHLKADRDANHDTKGNTLNIPFPAGQPMTVAITNQSTQKGAEIEDVKKQP